MTNNLQLNKLTPAISELVLSQPARRNAINAAMWAALPSVLETAANTPGLRALIVRGDGEHFASGADISEFGDLYATESSAKKISQDIAKGFDALANFPLPTIAIIRGACVGGGCGLALCCDIRFADNSAKFAITPAKLGLVYPYADIERLIQAVGIANAKDMLFSARVIKSKRAEKIGLVNMRCKADDLEADVMAYANALAANAPQSLITMKTMFAAYQAGQFGETDATRNGFHGGFSSEDFKEGYLAFMEKRKPDFSND